MKTTCSTFYLTPLHGQPLSRKRKVVSFCLAIMLVGLVMPVWAQYTPPSDGLVGWWRGDGNAIDSAHGHNGVLLDGATYNTGKIGQAFSLGPGSNRVYIPDSEDFKLTNSLSIAAWIYIKGDCWRILERAAYGPWTYTFGVDLAGHLIFGLNNLSTGSDFVSTPITYNTWKHVAATWDGVTGEMRIYVDGALAAQKVTVIRPSGDITAPQPGIGIGNTPLVGGWPFNGLIDEVVLYSRALSPSEVAFLAIDPAPHISVQPQGQVSYLGKDVTLSVSATGASPLRYLWYKESIAIPWATNSTLTLTNIQLSDVGDYKVVVTNAIGNVASSNAWVVVNPTGVSLGLFPGVVVEGAVGKSYGIQYTTNVHGSDWVTLGTLTLTQPVQVWPDTDANVLSGNNPKRFYRVVVLP